MVHHKETTKKNEWIKIRNGDKDELLIDFGNDEMKPTIWITEGEKSPDRDVALFIINGIKQINELITSFNKLRDAYKKRKSKPYTITNKSLAKKGKLYAKSRRQST